MAPVSDHYKAEMRTKLLEKVGSRSINAEWGRVFYSKNATPKNNSEYSHLINIKQSIEDGMLSNDTDLYLFARMGMDMKPVNGLPVKAGQLVDHKHETEETKLPVYKLLCSLDIMGKSNGSATAYAQNVYKNLVGILEIL